jgi:hypothetical protein
MRTVRHLLMRNVAESDYRWKAAESRGEDGFGDGQDIRSAGIFFMVVALKSGCEETPEYNGKTSF